MKKQVQGVILYRYRSTGISGQTVGADGNGTYAIVIVSDSIEQAEASIRRLVDDIQNRRGHEVVDWVVNTERFCGFPIQVIEQAIELDERENE